MKPLSINPCNWSRDIPLHTLNVCPGYNWHRNLQYGDIGIVCQSFFFGNVIPVRVSKRKDYWIYCISSKG